MERETLKRVVMTLVERVGPARNMNRRRTETAALTFEVEDFSDRGDDRKEMGDDVATLCSMTTRQRWGNVGR